MIIMLDGTQIRDKLVGSKEERAVSPVIGVILMVAVTVILAATIATMVMDIGDGVGQTAPQIGTEMGTNSDWDGASGSDQDLFYVSHQTGDTIESQNLRVIVRGEDGDTLATFDDDQDTAWGDSDTEEIWMQLNGENGVDTVADEAFEGGSTITIYASEDSAIAPSDGEEEVTVVIVDRSSDSTVAEHTGNPPLENVDTSG